MAHETRPNEINSSGSDGAPPSRTGIEAQRRQTAVRWLNRLYYDLAKWREGFIGFLRDYPGLRPDATEADFDLFYSGFRAYEEDLAMRAPLSQPYPDGKIIGELCMRAAFLEARLFKDFRWLFDEDKTGFEELRDAVGRVQTNPFDFSTVAERAIYSFRPHIEFSRAGATSKRASPKTIEKLINNYIEESNKPLQEIRGAAFKAGITLLTVEEYDKALHEEGSANPNIVVIGEVTTYNVNAPNRGVIQMSGSSTTTTTNIGTVSGSNVNIASALTNVSQSIGALQKADQATKDELQKLVTSLFEQLKAVPAEKTEQAEAVSAHVADVVDKAKQDNPNKSLLQSAISSLKSAADMVKDVAPTVVSLAGSIGSVIARLHGFG